MKDTEHDKDGNADNKMLDITIKVDNTLLPRDNKVQVKLLGGVITLTNCICVNYTKLFSVSKNTYAGKDAFELMTF
jgi:hypothetical protein